MNNDIKVYILIYHSELNGTSNIIGVFDDKEKAMSAAIVDSEQSTVYRSQYSYSITECEVNKFVTDEFIMV